MGSSISTGTEIIPIPADLYADWSRRRRLALRIASMLEDLPEYSHRAAGMRRCGRYRIDADGRLVAWTCGFLPCPMCFAKRIAKRKNPILRRLFDQPIPAEWTLLASSLTIRTVAYPQLGQAFDDLSNAWSRLIRRAPFAQNVGWLRSLEVTPRGRHRVHSHIHGILIAPCMAQALDMAGGLQDEFKAAAGLDYMPNVHSDVVASPDCPDDRKSWWSLVSYATKLPEVSDLRTLMSNENRLMAFCSAIEGRQLITVGKRLRVKDCASMPGLAVGFD